MAQKPPRVVAELGRPETLEETTARKAEQSRKYRANKTINNLWLSLIVCVAVVIVIVLLVPRNDTSQLQTIDYRSVATSAQAALPVPVAVPDLPTGWTSNAAEIRRGNDGVAYWYIGLVTPATTFVALAQGVDANDSWLSDQVHDTAASSTILVDGIQWTVYDNRSTSQDVGNAEYALTTTAGRSTYVLYGTASDTDVELVAAALTTNIAAQSTAGPAPSTGAGS
ncbi:hypothetical protein B7R54_11485 [Subtercola boreus]|uniref:DUF4245 domain-containing protein n=1 Tax=Subtercola boreus TaxID=120213 RepID=A0A3E0VJC7_9MICO|nr:DUF4245 domain-containing protein [Subtercola boreus]RFA09759.1 hypothetical protein B7R54_11485 [Subtercola boreus]TQL53131.1 uncharacterized protein DUF4245 [Subtercola boreus]